MSDLRIESPRLDPLPFIITDVVLLVAAFLIGWQADAPIDTGSLAAIALLVALGAIAALWPFVANHARHQEIALQERADQIEALARTVTASAEQISIAVSNLPAIADNSARQLKAAELLPSALREQLAALQQQLSATAHEENASLRHELDTLRQAETGKLVTALEGLNLATADLARLETLSAKHSTALDNAVTHLPRIADNFGAQAGEVLRRETAAAVAALHEAAAQSSNAIAAATAEARTAFERGVRDAVAHLATQATSTPPFPAHIATPRIIAPAPAPAATPAPAPPAASASASTPTTPAAASLPPEPAAPEPALALDLGLIDDANLDEPFAPELAPEPTPEPAPAPIPEPAHVSPSPETTDSSASADTDSDLEASEPTAPEELDPEPEPALEDPEPAAASEDSDSESSPAPSEPALTHDGYTRLVATAYIGIGNKLFIRGDGPGLRRDKGIPLQFVSIGKWRWESAELLFPVKVRLFKNDQIECTTVGEITLEPGHHHDVTAKF
jgi:hypothetical protein